MATTYCQHADLSAFLQLDTAFGAATPVTITDVEDIINRREDYIDARLNHAYRSATITNEYHDFTGLVHYHRFSDRWVKIYMNHRQVTTLDTGQSDKVEVWDGNDWEDYVVTRTEDRANDFWLDYTDGILFIKPRFTPREFGVRLSYRYGASTVPGWIEHLCIILTAHDLVMNEAFSNMLPEGADHVSYSSKTERWMKEADEIIASHAEIGVGAR